MSLFYKPIATTTSTFSPSVPSTSLTSRKIVDDFEDGDISEYAGATSDFAVQSTVQLEGDDTLAGQSTSGSSLIHSQSGLPYYPTQDDVYRAHLRADSGAGQGLAFFTQDAENLYLLQINYTANADDNNNEFKFKERVGGTDTDIATGTFSPTNGTRYVVEAWPQSDGTIVARVLNPSDGSELVRATVADETTYTSGGIGWRGLDDQYYDYATVPEVLTPLSLRMNLVSFACHAVKHDSGVGEQYAAYIQDDGSVFVAERTLPSGDWTRHDTGLTSGTSDIHHVTSLGIDADGFIHMVWGLHDDPLSGNYAVSNAANDPSSFAAQTGMTGNNESSQTYPQFFTTGGKLYYAAREGAHTSGVITLKEYDAGTSSWSDTQNNWIDGNGVGPYVDPIRVDQFGDIHATFNFRTDDNTGDGDGIQHEQYTYVTSTDGGSTWKQADGTTVSTPITRSNSTAFDPAIDEDCSNQNGLDLDENGRPHVAYLKDPGNGYLNYHHAYWNGSQWTINQVTSYASGATGIYTLFEEEIARPAIVIDRDGGGVFIFDRHGIDANAKVHHAPIGDSTYTTDQLGQSTWGKTEFNAFDYERWHSNGEMDQLLGKGLTTPDDLWMLDYTLSS